MGILNDELNVIAQLVSGFVILVIICMVFMTIFWIVFAYAEFKLLRAINYPAPWFAFIPFVNKYALGDICTQTTGGLQSVISGVVLPNFVLQFGWVITSILPFVPYVGGILGIVWAVFYFGTICDFIYKRVEGQDNKVLACLSGYFRIILFVKILLWNLPARGCQFRSMSTDVYPLRQRIIAGNNEVRYNNCQANNIHVDSVQNGYYGQTNNMQSCYGEQTNTNPVDLSKK